MTERKKITLNIAANIISFAITILISLFVTPVIVETLGGEAYGFVGLAGNFVSYAALVTIALNSMASRFVSIAIYQEDFEEANKYFTSVFFANLFIALVMVPVFAVIVWRLEYLIEIPAYLMTDVKAAFAITFLQFLLNVVLARYEIATFVTNKLYLNQKNALISSGIRLLLILLSFTLFSVKVSYLVLATFAGALFGYVMNVVYTKRFLPQMKIRWKDFDFRYIKRLVSSGVWNLLNRISSILLDGLDLLLSNVFLGAVEMGALAISKTVPMMFYSLRGTLDYPFAPPMTECYAKKDIDGLIRNARMGNKVLGIVMIAPMAAFAVYGGSFFGLWVPSQDGRMIHILALLAMLNLLASACINSVFSVFTIVNKVRVPAVVMLLTGVLTVIINLTLLKTTELGVYVIAATASATGLLRNYIFTPLYGAYCLGVKKSTFYHEIITSNLCLVLNLGVGWLFYQLVSQGETWVSLVLTAGSMAALCIVINYFVVLSREEQNFVFAVLRSKLKRG